jgi:hypothetical protein
MSKVFTDDFLEVHHYKHIRDLNDIEYNLYLEMRNRGLDHLNSLVRIYNYDRLCKQCDTIVSPQEAELSTCDKCCTEMVRNF